MCSRLSATRAATNTAIGMHQVDASCGIARAASPSGYIERALTLVRRSGRGCRQALAEQGDSRQRQPWPEPPCAIAVGGRRYRSIRRIRALKNGLCRAAEGPLVVRDGRERKPGGPEFPKPFASPRHRNQTVFRGVQSLKREHFECDIQFVSIDRRQPVPAEGRRGYRGDRRGQTVDRGGYCWIKAAGGALAQRRRRQPFHRRQGRRPSTLLAPAGRGNAARLVLVGVSGKGCEAFKSAGAEERGRQRPTTP